MLIAHLKNGTATKSQTLPRDEGGAVVVQTADDLPEDTAFLLDCFDEDVAILLGIGRRRLIDAEGEGGTMTTLRTELSPMEMAREIRALAESLKRERERTAQECARAEAALASARHAWRLVADATTRSTSSGA